MYALSAAGECTAFDAAGAFNVVGRNKLPGTFPATPAVGGGRLFLRSDAKLYGVGP